MFRRRRVPTVLACALLAATLSPVGAGAHPRTSTESAAVLIQWNQIAQTTIYPPGGTTPIHAGQVQLGLVSMAMYDAVQGTRRSYGHSRSASPSAAAAAAAHDVLAYYYPSSLPALDTALAGTLAGLPAGSSRDWGVAIGEDEAEDLLESREDDGWGVAISFTRPPAIGVWRPTTAGALFSAPWVGFLDLLVVDSTRRLDPGSPDRLTSADYALDVAEVQLMGALNSTTRTTAETATALFYNFNVPIQMNSAMRGAATGSTIFEAARLFGLTNTSAADAIITCWREKYDQPLWRPVTAIHEAADDGNPRTYPDPTWAPLVASPPYPEWTSGHACLMGAYTRSLQLINRTDTVDLVLPSVVNGASVTRHYTSAEAIQQDAFNARIWLGIHFRRSMEAGAYVGEKAATSVYDRFSPRW